MVRDKVDLPMISETKLDISFPDAQFCMKSYSKPYGLDRNSKEGGIILYLREDIPSKLINSSLIDHGKEYFLVELNIRKQKWVTIYIYNPDETMIKRYLEYISKEIESHSSKYDNFFLLGDFNSEPTKEAMKSFCQIHNFKNLLDRPSYHKNPTNPSCIDLIITNIPRSFQNSCTFETGFSDFHKMPRTVLKSSSAKQKPRVLNYCNYKFFNNTLSRDQALNELRISNLQISNKDLKHFKETFLSVVNTTAPLKNRFIRANQAPFINKEFQRAVMVRSKLRNKFHKSRSVSDKKAYNKQRNKCISLLRKTKKAYYSNLNVKDIVDNKKFLKTIKNLFSDKSNNFENTSLIENGNLLTDDFEITETFNKYFQNLLPNLDLKVPSNLLCQTPGNGDEVLAAIYEYQNHPSIKTILENCNFGFSFKTVSLTDIKKEMKSLNSNKASHSSDMPTKILKQNLDFFSPFISGYVIKSISSSTSILKLTAITQYIKKIRYTRKFV